MKEKWITFKPYCKAKNCISKWVFQYKLNGKEVSVRAIPGELIKQIKWELPKVAR